MQQVLQGNRVISYSRVNPLFPLCGTLVCPTCGKPATAGESVGHMGKKYPRYWCVSKGCADPLGISAEEIHKEWLSLLEIQEPTEDFLLHMPDVPKRQLQQRRERLRNDKRMLELKIEEQPELQRRAVTAKTQGRTIRWRLQAVQGIKRARCREDS